MWVAPHFFLIYHYKANWKKLVVDLSNLEVSNRALGIMFFSFPSVASVKR
ncbi:MAG: hypothetical protein AAFX46_03710 [Cyanobacteria bacterium J06636_27]